jgi:hypothetical protein
MNLQESIRRILREEGKYLKDSENARQLIIKRLNAFFSGAQMYHEKVYEFRHDFQFCKNGKEIAEVWLYFHDEDYDLYESNDKRPTSERPFSEGTLKMNSETIYEILKFIPVRRNYLLYIIENWFEDTYLTEIKKKMGRNDLEIDELYVSGTEISFCVPPVSKPDDVSYEDMVTYIMKGTLFTRKDIENNEKEEPGWVEDLYLKKLRQSEVDKLRGDN